MSIILACPVCKLPLAQDLPKTYICPNNHTFDIAKQGYVNLLLASQGSKELGDSREMFLHRRQFLDAGFYNPISDHVNVLLQTVLTQNNQDTVNILDAGCGEGFYTHRLKNFLTQIRPDTPLDILGIDISKFGVQIAAKRDPTITFAVASVGDLPVQADSLDFIVSFFSPVNYQEFSRVLKPDGQLITVKAGSNHLYALRQVIYAGQAEPLQDKASAKYSPYFTLKQSAEVSYNLALKNQADISNLALMTPYSWHLDSEIKLRLEQLEELQTPIEASIKLFTKN